MYSKTCRSPDSNLIQYRSHPKHGLRLRSGSMEIETVVRGRGSRSAVAGAFRASLCFTCHGPWIQHRRTMTHLPRASGNQICLPRRAQAQTRVHARRVPFASVRKKAGESHTQIAKTQRASRKESERIPGGPLCFYLTSKACGTSGIDPADVTASSEGAMSEGRGRCSLKSPRQLSI